MKKSERIIAAALTMVIGILLITLQDEFIGILMTVAGVSLIVLGIVDIFNRFVPPAVVKIVTGILIIICGWALVEAVLYIVAALLLMAGVLLIYDMIKKRHRCETVWKTVIEYAIPSLFLAIGMLLLFHQTLTMKVIFIICGILTLMEGGVLLINAFDED